MLQPIWNLSPSPCQHRLALLRRWTVLGSCVLALVESAASPALATQFACTWGAGQTGNWTDTAKWTSCNGTFPNNGVTDTYTASIPSGNVTLDQAISIDELTFSGGTITGGFNLDVGGMFTWSGGSMSGAGTTHANGDMTLNGTTKSMTRILNLAGGHTATWTAGNLTVGGTLNNAGSFDLQGNVSISSGGGSASFENTGSFLKSSGAGTSEVAIDFNNSGNAEVDAGTLKLSGGGSSSGSFSASASATLEFGAGTHTLGASSSITATTVVFSAGIENIDGSYDVAGTTTVSGGTVHLTGAVPSAWTSLGISSGNLDLSNSAGSQDTAALTLSGGTLSGTSTLNVSGLVTWTGGVMSGSGTTNANGGASLAGTTKNLTRTLNIAVAQAANWTAGNIINGGILNNAGNFNVSASLSMTSGGGNPAVSNTGDFKNTSVAGTTNIGVVFNNNGTVEITSGTLKLSGGGNSDGSFTDSGSATLEFGAGTHALSAASSIAGPAVVFSAGTATIAGSYNVTTSTTVSGGTAHLTGGVPNAGATLSITSGTLDISNTEGTLDTGALTLSSGTLSGSSTLNVIGLVTWTGGSMSGSGTTNANGGASLGGTTKFLTRTLSIAPGQTANWTAGNISNGGTLINDGNFNVSANLTMNNGGGSPLVSNTGEFMKTGSVGTADIGVGFDNSGTVQVTSGTLKLSNGGSSDGSFTDSGSAVLEFGAGIHNLQTASSIAGPQVRFTAGTVNIDGDYDVTTSTTVSGGTVHLMGSVPSAGTLLNVSGGTLDLSNIEGMLDTRYGGPQRWHHHGLEHLEHRRDADLDGRGHERLGDHERQRRHQPCRNHQDPLAAHEQRGGSDRHLGRRRLQPRSCVSQQRHLRRPEQCTHEFRRRSSGVRQSGHLQEELRRGVDGHRDRVQQQRHRRTDVRYGPVFEQ